MVDIEGADSDILERFDFELEDLIDQSKFADALNKKLHVRQQADASQFQIESMFDVFDITKTKFPEAGISTARFNLFGKPQVRFGIKGQRGLFGISKALKFFRLGKI